MKYTTKSNIQAGHRHSFSIKEIELYGMDAKCVQCKITAEELNLSFIL